jgi:hypothetical protein
MALINGGSNGALLSEEQQIYPQKQAMVAAEVARQKVAAQASAAATVIRATDQPNTDQRIAVSTMAAAKPSTSGFSPVVISGGPSSRMRDQFTSPGSQTRVAPVPVAVIPEAVGIIDAAGAGIAGYINRGIADLNPVRRVNAQAVNATQARAQLAQWQQMDNAPGMENGVPSTEGTKLVSVGGGLYQYEEILSTGGTRLIGTPHLAGWWSGLLKGSSSATQTNDTTVNDMISGGPAPAGYGSVMRDQYTSPGAQAPTPWIFVNANGQKVAVIEPGMSYAHVSVDFSPSAGHSGVDPYKAGLLPVETPDGRSVGMYFDPKTNLFLIEDPYSGYNFNQLAGMYGTKAAQYLTGQAAVSRFNGSGTVSDNNVVNFDSLDLQIAKNLDAARGAENQASIGQNIMAQIGTGHYTLTRQQRGGSRDIFSELVGEVEHAVSDVETELGYYTNVGDIEKGLRFQGNLSETPLGSMLTDTPSSSTVLSSDFETYHPTQAYMFEMLPVYSALTLPIGSAGPAVLEDILGHANSGYDRIVRGTPTDEDVVADDYNLHLGSGQHPGDIGIRVSMRTILGDGAGIDTYNAMVRDADTDIDVDLGGPRITTRPATPAQVSNAADMYNERYGFGENPTGESVLRTITDENGNKIMIVEQPSEDIDPVAAAFTKAFLGSKNMDDLLYVQTETGLRPTVRPVSADIPALHIAATGRTVADVGDDLIDEIFDLASIPTTAYGVYIDDLLGNMGSHSSPSNSRANNGRSLVDIANNSISGTIIDTGQNNGNESIMDLMTGTVLDQGTAQTQTQNQAQAQAQNQHQDQWIDQVVDQIVDPVTITAPDSRGRSDILFGIDLNEKRKHTPKRYAVVSGYTFEFPTEKWINDWTGMKGSRGRAVTRTVRTSSRSVHSNKEFDRLIGGKPTKASRSSSKYGSNRASRGVTKAMNMKLKF